MGRMMFLFHWGGATGLGCDRGAKARPRRSTSSPAHDRPVVLLAAPEAVVRELQAAGGHPFYFGDGGPDPSTAVDRQLRDAVRLAAHPVDLVRRLGEWADHVQ